MHNTKLRLQKKDIVRHQKTIETLFNSPQKIYGTWLQIHFTIEKKAPPPQPQTPSPQILFIVSKRKFKRAVDRNRIKRLMKQAFRLNKNNITDTSKQFQIALIYKATNIATYQDIETDIKELFQQLNPRIKNEDH